MVVMLMVMTTCNQEHLIVEPNSSQWVLDAHNRGITKISGFGQVRGGQGVRMVLQYIAVKTLVMATFPLCSC